MKKFRFFLLAAAAALLSFTACHKEKQETDPNSLGKFPLSQIVDAAATAYGAWETDEAFPESFKIGDKDFSIAQYQYAICNALVNINSGVKDDIEVIEVKPASHPERDSYDKETIQVANGPKNGDETEDLVNVAKRIIASIAEKREVPNQTNYTRNGNWIAFSTDRATIVISRVLAQYKADGKLPESVDAGYKGASNTLKAFAQQLVTYLDVWEKTVGTVDADGSHCTANNTAWKNVHFIPIEYSGGYKDGEMYDEAKFPIHHITVDGVEYNAAQCWSIAAQGIMDLVTKEGSSLLQPTRNPFVHTMANGASLNETMPAPADYATVTGFNAYPWYENTNDGPIINFSETLPCTVEFLAHELGWYLTRCTQFDTPAIGNFQQFGKGESVINFGDYSGTISAMRTFLIMIRFYDYLLKNDITENVWDATKDVHLNYDLYGVAMPDIEVKTKKLDFDCTEQTKEATFTAKKAWTATASENWITVEPASGEAGDITLKITVAANQGDAREGKVIVKGGNVTDGIEIAINQVKYTAPSEATIKDFAQEYVKIINVWASHVGNINRLSNWEIAKDTDEDVVENVHYVPNDYTIVVGGKTYNTADMLETALRSYLLLRGWDGNETEKNGFGNIPKYNPVTMSATVPNTHGYTWGKPLIESSNGGPLVKLEGEKEIHCQVDPVILDNWAQRSVNFQHGKDITNFCTYPRADHNITNYKGCFSSGRALLTYAYFFKYMLDNNLEKADGIAADVVIRSELFGNEEGSQAEMPVTIKDFAKEYVKILDIWEKTTGTIDYVKKSDTESIDAASQTLVENAHYVPMATTITVGGKTYNTADMLETALRSFLLLRGYDGNETEKNGFGNIPKYNPLPMSAPVPETHNYYFGNYPYAEPSNGGYLCKVDGDKEIYRQVEVRILDNWAQRSVNFQHGQSITNMCTYPRADHNITDYKGCFSAMRALITYAHFFKYMLDNNLEKADGIEGSQIIRSELFGVEAAPEPAKATIKDFAKEYVKILDIWEKTTGTVDYVMKSDAETHDPASQSLVENAHYVPMATTITVGGKTYNTADMLELALRSYLLLRGYDGNETEKNGFGNIPQVSPVSMSADLPETHKYYYGNYPYAEPSNGGYLRKLDGEKEIFHKVEIRILDNWAQRSVNFQHGQAITNMCTYPRADHSITDYKGCFSAMRALITYAHFFKYMLDNNLEKASVSDLGANVEIRSELFGVE